MDKEYFEENNSELHKLFDVMRKSRNKLLTIFDMFPDGIIMLDKSFKIIHINRSRANFLGKEPKDLISRYCYREFKNADSPCVDCPVAKSFQSGHEETSIMFERSGRTEHVFEVNAFPQKNSDGDVFSAIEYTKDITEQRMLEERMLKSEKLAFLGEMAAGIGHELITPLSGIFMSIQDISKDIDTSSPHQETFGLILTELRRMEGFIRQLLKISKPAPLVLKPVNIHKDILEHVLFLLWDVTRKNSFKVERKYNKEIPSIKLDHGQILSVFLNIISNAFKAMRTLENGLLTISTDCVYIKDDDNYFASANPKKERMLEVKIGDNGCGILPEDIERVYEPFFSRVEGGFGLGLSTTNKIVKKHRGTISVESEYGKGTTFTVLLPFSSEKKYNLL